MNEPAATPRTLHLIVEGFPAEKLRELEASVVDLAEIFELTEASAGEALEKIFAADHVAAWTKLEA